MAQIRLSRIKKHRILFNGRAHIKEVFDEVEREDNDNTNYLEN